MNFFKIFLIFFLIKKDDRISHRPKIIYSIFQSLSGKFSVLVRSVCLHIPNGKTLKSQPSIFVGWRCCARLCTFVKQGRCRQSRCTHLSFFRVGDYLQFLLTLHRRLFGLVPFQLSHTLFESLSLLWVVGLRHHLSKPCHHSVGRFIS